MEKLWLCCRVTAKEAARAERRQAAISEIGDLARRLWGSAAECSASRRLGAPVYQTMLEHMVLIVTGYGIQDIANANR